MPPTHPPLTQKEQDVVERKKSSQLRYRQCTTNME
jgi:hypothetical protein